MSKARLSHHQIVQAGLVVEVRSSSNPIGFNLKSSKRTNIYYKRTDDPKIHESAIARTRNNVIRLVNSNAYRWQNGEGEVIEPQFLTFTFAENETDVTYTNSEFTAFIKRLNYHFFHSKKSIIKYLTVIEFQERGAVHYHTIFFNLPKIDFKQERKDRVIASIWGHGFIDAIPIHSRNIGFYIAKYMTKVKADKRLVGRRRYFCSKGLIKPLIITREHEALEIISLLHENEASYKHGWYKHPVTGLTFYAMYELSEQAIQEYFGQYNSKA